MGYLKAINMSQKLFNIIMLILFSLFSCLFIFGQTKWGDCSLNFQRIERALEVERIERKKIMERVLAAEKRPDINIKYGTVITDKDAIIVVEEEK